ISMQGSAHYPVTFPLQVKVFLEGGPLQGAIHWKGEESKSIDFTLQSESDVVSVPLTISGKCDFVNREDGTCVDFAYLQVWPTGFTQPIAKKRFYLRLTPQASGVTGPVVAKKAQ